MQQIRYSHRRSREPLSSLAFLAAWRDNVVCRAVSCQNNVHAKATSTAYLAKPPRTPRTTESTAQNGPVRSSRPVFCHTLIGGLFVVQPGGCRAAGDSPGWSAKRATPGKRPHRPEPAGWRVAQSPVPVCHPPSGGFSFTVHATRGCVPTCGRPFTPGFRLPPGIRRAHTATRQIHCDRAPGRHSLSCLRMSCGLPSL